MDFYIGFMIFMIGVLSTILLLNATGIFMAAAAVTMIGLSAGMLWLHDDAVRR